MGFRDTLRQGALEDLNFTNDRFEASLRANYAASDDLTINAYLLEKKGEELGVDINPAAEAIIKFGGLVKGSYRKLDQAAKDNIKAAFADLYPSGAVAEAEIEKLFNSYVDFQATSGDVVEVGDELLAEEPPVEE